MVLDNHRLCVLFILLYNWRQNQRVKRAYSQANWAHIRGNLLSLMTHTRVIIICIQNKSEGNTSGEKKNVTYRVIFYACIYTALSHCWYIDTEEFDVGNIIITHTPTLIFIIQPTHKTCCYSPLIRTWHLTKFYFLVVVMYIHDHDIVRFFLSRY